jgi:hypothetical protein
LRCSFSCIRLSLHSARSEHLHGPAGSHSFVTFILCSFPHCSWGGRCFYITGSSCTGCFPFFILEGADPFTVSTCF